MYNNFFSILLEKLLFYRYKDAERRYMRIDIPEGANKVIEGLEAAGYEAYIVGGCVRDSILEESRGTGISPHLPDLSRSRRYSGEP